MNVKTIEQVLSKISVDENQRFCYSAPALFNLSGLLMEQQAYLARPTFLKALPPPIHND